VPLVKRVVYTCKWRGTSVPQVSQPHLFQWTLLPTAGSICLRLPPLPSPVCVNGVYTTRSSLQLKPESWDGNPSLSKQALLLPSIFPLFRPLRSPPPVIASTEVSELFYRRGCPGVNNALSFHSITSATPCGVLRTDPVVLMGLRKGAYNPCRNRYTCALVGSVFSVIALALCPGAMPGAHRFLTPPPQRTDAGPAAVIFPTLLVDFVLSPPFDASPKSPGNGERILTSRGALGQARG
jgi:hypothetical protein